MKITVDGTTYDVVVYPDDTAYGKWTCTVPRLPGVKAYGQTHLEATQKIAAQIEADVSDYKKEVEYWETRWLK